MRNLLVAIVVLLVIDLNFANAFPSAHRMKREDDFATMAMAGGMAVMDLMQKGAGVENGFHAKSGNENSNQISSG